MPAKANEKRSKSKLKRGKGVLAMQEKGVTELEWMKAHDPLYKIKGQKRHNMLKKGGN
jgi:hypothetical protein